MPMKTKIDLSIKAVMQNKLKIRKILNINMYVYHIYRYNIFHSRSCEIMLAENDLT